MTVARQVLRAAGAVGSRSTPRHAEGGEEGGEVIAAGTPEEVALVEGSSTGQFLRAVLAEPAAAAA